MTWVYRTSKKNDRIDARKQAVLLSIGEVPPVHIPKRQVRQWRATIQQRRGIVNRIVSVKNRIRALLKANGLAQPCTRAVCGRSPISSGCVRRPGLGRGLGRAALAGAPDGPAGGAQAAGRTAQGRDQLPGPHPGRSSRRHAADEHSRSGSSHGRGDPGLYRRGQAIPASKQYGAYFGLTPKLDESGQTRRLGHISKEGPSVVRWLLVESVWRAIQKSPALKAFYERIVGGQNLRKKVAVVATARKLLTIMRAMLKTGELFNEELVSRQEQSKTNKR